MKDLKEKLVIPTVIFRTPIHINRIFDIQGMLLAFGKYRETPYLSDWEKSRLKQLAATEKWIEFGGEIKSGLWRKDGQCCAPLSFIENNYQNGEWMDIEELVTSKNLDVETAIYNPIIIKNTECGTFLK